LRGGDDGIAGTTPPGNTPHAGDDLPDTTTGSAL